MAKANTTNGIFRLPFLERAVEFTGERMTTASDGLEFEHLHRYCLARDLCRGLDVLDVASGEGYGSAILANVARSVIGVETDPGSVRHAQQAYSAKNLRFVQGSGLDLPLDDASVDAVVSFETVEHIREHSRFASEVRRVLRPGGRFIASTPNQNAARDELFNDSKLMESTAQEFEAFLHAHFANVVLLRQQSLLSSLIAAADRSLWHSYERGSQEYLEASGGLARAPYLLGVASDAELPEIASSAYVDRQRIDNVLQAALRDRAISEQRDAALAEAEDLRDAARAALAEAEAQRDAARAALAKYNARTFSAAPRPIGRAARVLVAPFRRPARLFRFFLVDDIQQKIDRARWTIETLGETLSAFRTDASRHTVDLAARIDSLTAGLAARVDSVETRLEELSLRVRTPIEVDDSTVAVRTADGFVLVPRSDTTLLLMLCDAGPQGLEPGTRRLLTRLLVSGMMFVDVGAHIGLLTLAGARAVGPQGRVVAFEPTPITFDLLIRALAISGLGDRVEAQRLACGARAERRAFHVATVLGHSSLLEPATVGSDRGVQRIEVDVVRLDDVLPTGARVDVVKIDVEGAELDVLAGMTRILGENPDLAIIAEFGPAHLRRARITPEAWFEAFHMHGLEAYAIDELSDECNRVGHQDLTAVESVNILFCRTNSRAAAHAKS